MEHTAWCVGALVALLTAAAVKAAEAREEDLFWRNVTVRLEGALPNTDPRLADVLEIYLGRVISDN